MVRILPVEFLIAMTAAGRGTMDSDIMSFALVRKVLRRSEDPTLAEREIRNEIAIGLKELNSRKTL